MRWLALWFVLAALGVACRSSSSAGSACASAGGTCGSAAEDAGGAQDVQAPPACTWPAVLEPPDSSTRPCVAARAYLACKGSNGDTELCSSSDFTQCPGPDAVPGETFSACVDQCNADEYAVECGGVGPAPSPPLPAGCRSLLSGPGGGITGCCPCGPPDDEAEGGEAESGEAESGEAESGEAD